MKRLTKGYLALIIIATIIIIDQILKIWVKTHFYLGEDLTIASWFHLYFIENNGMAFGMELGSKLMLTLLRIVAVGLIVYYICRIKDNPQVKTGYIIVLSMIAAGAAGNIIDCMFYGVMFNDPMPPMVASMCPDGGGYAPLFHGKVVDMLYFPLFSFDWPAWMPWIGGEHFLFFQPVFNFADAAITVGIFILVIWYAGCLTATGVPVKADKSHQADDHPADNQ